MHEPSSSHPFPAHLRGITYNTGASIQSALLYPTRHSILWWKQSVSEQLQSHAIRSSPFGEKGHETGTETDADECKGHSFVRGLHHSGVEEDFMAE
jgi:hypothetical protein